MINYKVPHTIDLAALSLMVQCIDILTQSVVVLNFRHRSYHFILISYKVERQRICIDAQGLFFVE